MAARANVNFYTIDPRGLAGMTTDFMEGGRDRQRGRRDRPVLFVPGTNTPEQRRHRARPAAFQRAG